MRILIVEDEFITRSTLERSLKRMGYTISGAAADAQGALDVLAEGNTDLAILDINIEGDRDGIWVAQQVREQYKLPFIFLTAYGDEQTVERAMATRPYGYLMKPFETVDIYAAIRTALTNFSQANVPEPAPVKSEEDSEQLVAKDSMFIRDGHLFTKIKFADIRFVKAEGNYVSIQTAHKKHLARGTMKEFEEKLPKRMFFRTQKSYIINLELLSSLAPRHVVLDGGEEIPMSERARPELMQLLNI